MKYLLLGVVLLTLATATKVNTTDFWNQKVGYKLNFQSFTGYENIDWYFDAGKAAMYYSMWQGWGDDIKDHTVPVIVWLQGGPGAPSQFGCFN